MTRIGAHVSTDDPIAHAAEMHAPCVQIFVGNPSSWRVPKFHTKSVEISKSNVRTFVHAPYLINIATPNEKNLVLSRNALLKQSMLAAELGSPGVVVHGGSATDGDLVAGYYRWRSFFVNEMPQTKILIENDAKGTNTITRHLDSIEKLWRYVGGLPNVGFCMDTCHAWASGEDPDTYVLELLEIVGKIDLVHANGSKDHEGSGRDRHSPFSTSVLPVEKVAEMIMESGAEDVIVESSEPADDIRALKEALNATSNVT